MPTAVVKIYNDQGELWDEIVVEHDNEYGMDYYEDSNELCHAISYAVQDI